MSNKDKNKTVRQFRISWPGFARVIWGVCVVLLIVAMVVTAGIALVSLFIPPAPVVTSSDTTPTETIDPQVLQTLIQQYSKSGTPGVTSAP